MVLGSCQRGDDGVHPADCLLLFFISGDSGCTGSGFWGLSFCWGRGLGVNGKLQWGERMVRPKTRGTGNEQIGVINLGTGFG